MIEKETIKGLECCLDEKVEKCDECPYCVDTIMCKRRELLEDIFNLINQKQELLEAAIAGQETLQKALTDKDRIIKRLNDEKVQLIRAFSECQTEAARVLVEKDKEIERLKNELFCLANERDSIASRNGTGELKMRDFLFRGKRKDNGEWVTGFYVHYDDTKDNHKDDCDYIVGIHTGEHFPFFEVLPETIGQYTGKTDKNGKKIFEGDIVKTDKFSEPNKQYIIKYDLQFGAFIGQDRYNCYFVTFDGDSDEFEVIGNIHDNPKLLKGGDEE